MSGPRRGLRGLLTRAVDRRAPLADLPHTTAYRLVHGAGDGLPGVYVDRYGTALVAHLHDPAFAVGELVEVLRALLPDVKSVYVKRHPPRQSGLSQRERTRLAPPTPEWGAHVESVLVAEQGLRFEVRPGHGLSVGLFPDMREGRGWVHTRAEGRTVLNLFAYTCGFGVAAAAGGAARTLNVDLSRAALDWGKGNYALNGLTARDRDFVYGDAFDWLARLRRRDERFDMVIVDPPSFSSARRGRFSAVRDFGRLAELAAGTVARAGILFLATNHARISPGRFGANVEWGVHAAGRRIRLGQSWAEPAMDFPAGPGERAYLKILALRLD